MAVLSAVLLAVASQRRGEWDGLQAGLVAWEAFGFDKGFSLEVKAEGQTLFTYPDGTAKAVPPGTSKATVSIQGASGGFLQQVTQPFVDYIVEGKDPSNPAGESPDTVSRHDLLLKGGGITLPQLAHIKGFHGDFSGWDGIPALLKAWQSTGWDVNFTVNAGTVEKTLFTHTVGSLDMNTRVLGASLSKWPAAMTVSGLVAAGKVNFEDKVNKYLDWWSKDPSDTRSNVTLRHLLTFQSGYLSDGEAYCSQDPSADYLKCARELYESKSMQRGYVAPGTAFAYLSCHLQFAGAVAVAASGLNPKELFETYFYKPLGTNATTWGQPPYLNPQFATGITTTGSDFEKFLRGMLSYDFLGRDVLSYAERDWSAPPVSPCGDGWFGHYGMGHWFDCLGYGAGTRDGSSAALPQRCLDEDIQAGPGAYAYFPLIDRKRGYYLQIVCMEDPTCRSENPEYLRAALKPITDAAVAGKSIPTTQELLAQGGGVTLAEITDIWNCVPPQCTPPAWPPSHL